MAGPRKVGEVWVAYEERDFYERENIIGITTSLQVAKDLCAEVASQDLNWLGGTDHFFAHAGANGWIFYASKMDVLD